MKKILKSILSIAAAAMTFASCSVKEINPEVRPSGKMVYFGTELSEVTKATLTPDDDDATFEAAWENNDAMKVSAFLGETYKGDFDAEWVSEKEAFASSNASTYFGTEHNFVAVYPACDAEGEIAFGAERVQNGNKYNGAYDVMLSQKTPLTLAENQTFIFNMDRQTAIAYFHLTSSYSDEKVISAKLSVNEETLAGNFLYAEGEIVPVEESNSITLTFTDAPSIDDLQLWFNVLPGTYTGLTLEVETESHTLTIQNSKSVTYAAGKLYKVVADATAKYEAKPDELTISEFLTKEDDKNIFYQLTGKITDIANAEYGNFTIEDHTGSVYVYGMTATKTANSANDQSFASLNLEVGDVITLCGVHGSYNYTPQVGGKFDSSNIAAYYVSTLVVPSLVAEPIVDVPSSGVDAGIQDATYTAVEGWNYEASCDNTTVTEAELDEESIIYSVSANSGDAREGWIKFTFSNSAYLYQHVETVSVSQLPGIAPAAWVKTNYENIPNGAEVVVTMTADETTYALSMNNVEGARASGKAPAAVEVELNGDKLNSTPNDILVWNMIIDGNAFMLVCKSDAQYHVYSNDSNDGVRVGKDTDDKGNNKFIIDETSGYIKSSTLTRYLGVYTQKPDWRCYTGPTAANIKDQTLAFYVKDDGKQDQPDFAFASETATATVGSEFAEPTLNGKLTSGSVVFSSSEPAVATVNPETGKVSLVKAGTTVIKAIAPADETYREAVATYTLTVKHVLSSISLNTENVIKEFTPSDDFTSAGLIVTAHYNDDTKAEVSENITVVAPSMEEGEQTVTVKYTEDGVTKSNTYTIKVENKDIPVTGVSLDITSETLAVNGTVQLTATVLPVNATNKNVEWSTSDASVATVSTSGLVTAIGTGDATITVKSVADPTKSATCAIKVLGTGTLSINFEKATDKYTKWTFTNITTQQEHTAVKAHGGSYFGTTNSKTTGSIRTKSKVSPKSILFYISKTTTNTTASNWKIQTSADGNNWSDANTVSATSMDRGEWAEVSHNFTSADEVYVRVYYDGTTAVRCIDDLTLTIYGEGDPAPSDPVKLDAPANLKCSAQTSSSLTFVWDEVENASDYKVSLDNQSTWISTNQATKYTWTGLSAEQTKAIYVKAIGDGEEYLDSDVANAEGTTSASSSGGDTPSVGTVMWSETWEGGDANETPSSYGQEGTTVYNGGTVTYSSSYANTKLYNDTMETTNLLLYGNKSGKDTWVVGGIPTGGVSKLTLTLEVNNSATGRCVISSPTAGVNVGNKTYSGTASPYTITVPITITGNVGTFELNFSNTTTSNVRIDNVKIVVAN